MIVTTFDLPLDIHKTIHSMQVCASRVAGVSCCGVAWPGLAWSSLAWPVPTQETEETQVWAGLAWSGVPKKSAVAAIPWAVALRERASLAATDLRFRRASHAPEPATFPALQSAEAVTAQVKCFPRWSAEAVQVDPNPLARRGQGFVPQQSFMFVEGNCFPVVSRGEHPS